MPLTLNPQLAAALAALAGDGPPASPPEVGDWRTLRNRTAVNLAALGSAVPRHLEVTRTAYTVTSADGTEIDLRWFSVEGTRSRSAIVHAHGGGMIAGSVDLSDPYVTEHVAMSGVPFLAVDYRLAPEVRGSVPAEDVYAALTWLIAHAGELDVEPEHVALLGESAGAGIAAGTAILARDRGIPLARQILIYPMLDDRTITADPHLVPLASWNYANNQTGWGAHLGEDFGKEIVSPIAAPARLTDFAGLAPAYIEVGELDIFRDEGVSYAGNLWHAGVSVELHVHPGVPHAFDLFAHEADVTRRAIADRIRVIRSV